MLPYDTTPFLTFYPPPLSQFQTSKLTGEGLQRTKPPDR